MTCADAISEGGISVDDNIFKIDAVPAITLATIG